MIYRTKPEKIAEYRERNALNQTSLKAILSQGVQYYYDNASTLQGKDDRESDLYYEEKEHFVIGTAVDNYITFGEEWYNNNYHFSNVRKPSPTIMSIVKMVYDVIKNDTQLESLDYYRATIHSACDQHEYYMKRRKDNYEEDSRVVTVLKDQFAASYFEELKMAGNKIVLSDGQNMAINQITTNFTSHPFTEWLFKDKNGIDIIYQLPIYFEYEGVFCKMLVDMLYIDHHNKIIRPIDIKTIGDYVAKFNREVKRRRYDIQASFYLEGIKNNPEIISDTISRSVKGYRLSPFAFVVESSKVPRVPLIFPVEEDLMLTGRMGNADLNMDGWVKAIQLFKHWSTHNFELDRVLGSTNGVVKINANFDYNLTF